MDYLKIWRNKMEKEEKKERKKNSPKKSTTKTTTKNTKKEPKKTVNKPMKVEEITLEEADSYYHVSLLAQAICVVGILALSVLAIFENSFTIPIEVLVGITLLVMAYNNVILFKRKGLTIIYIIFGIMSIIFGIMGYIK
jgi:hypothetical protein